MIKCSQTICGSSNGGSTFTGPMVISQISSWCRIVLQWPHRGSTGWSGTATPPADAQGVIAKSCLDGAMGYPHPVPPPTILETNPDRFNRKNCWALVKDTTGDYNVGCLVVPPWAGLDIARVRTICDWLVVLNIFWTLYFGLLISDFFQRGYSHQPREHFRCSFHVAFELSLGLQGKWVPNWLSEKNPVAWRANDSGWLFQWLVMANTIYRLTMTYGTNHISHDLPWLIPFIMINHGEYHTYIYYRPCHIGFNHFWFSILRWSSTTTFSTPPGRLCDVFMVES